jgi:hypothetical protein
MIDFPIPEAFIVGEGEKTKAKFEREIARRTFEQSALREVTLFLYYDDVRDTWQKFQAVGEGSRGWSRPSSKPPSASEAS